MKQRLRQLFSGNPVFVTVFAILCILVFQFYWLRGDYLEKKQQLTDEVSNKLNSVILKENLRETNEYLTKMKTNKLMNDLTSVLTENLGSEAMPEIHIYTDTSESGTSESDLEVMEKLGLTSVAKEKPNPAAFNKIMRHKIDSVLRPLHISYTLYLPSKSLIAPNDQFVLAETRLLQNGQFAAVELKDFFSTVVARMLSTGLLSLLYLSICIGAIILLNRNLRHTRNLMVLKRNFTNNMTHELKTPLATIYAATESLDKYNMQDDPAVAKEYLGFIKGEVDRLNLLIDTILVHAQLENNKLYLNRETIHFRDLIRSSAERMQPRIAERRATLELPETPETITLSGDSNHLTNIFTNLIDNALKYSGESPVITLGTQVSGGFVRVTVSDNGIGISEKHLRHIFDPYFRVPESNLHSVKGYGLGLNYVREIIQLHGGKIRVESRVGKGTTFMIDLPLAHE